MNVCAFVCVCVVQQVERVLQKHSGILDTRHICSVFYHLSYIQRASEKRGRLTAAELAAAWGSGGDVDAGAGVSRMLLCRAPLASRLAGKTALLPGKRAARAPRW